MTFYQMNTFTGKTINPVELRASDVCIEDIAHSLSQLNRYNGHGKYPFPVGQHSLNCAYIMRRMNRTKRLQMLALIHDAAEAYISDIPLPVKDKWHGYGNIEAFAINAVYEGLGITPPDKWEYKLVYDVDRDNAKYEAYYLFDDLPWAQQCLLLPQQFFMESSPAIIEKEFLYAYQDLAPFANGRLEAKTGGGA